MGPFPLPAALGSARRIHVNDGNPPVLARRLHPRGHIMRIL
jgi:hypothetical protein